MSKHKERGITFAEYGALLGTRAMLAAGELEQTNEKDAIPGKHCFNMNISGVKNHCGTVSCIGGTMAYIMRKNPDNYIDVGSSRSLHDLFFPTSEDWTWITPQIAVQAIDNWLEIGDPKWDQLKYNVL